jgi:hypothetical protein
MAQDWLHGEMGWGLDHDPAIVWLFTMRRDILEKSGVETQCTPLAIRLRHPVHPTIIEIESRIMGRASLALAIRTTGDGRIRAVSSLALGVAFGLSSAGCGKGPPTVTNSAEVAVDSTSDNSGLKLPPDFKAVNIPLDQRKEVFKEAHDIRALAVQEANQELPMDEASLPIGDTAAFDKRVADHKAIINRILAQNLPPLAVKYKISVADVEKIEEEANRLRWLPPQDPVLDTKQRESNENAQRKVDSKAEKKDESRTEKTEAK